MTAPRHAYMALLVTLLLMSACSGLPPQQQSVSDYLEAQKSSARQLQLEGRLADSLNTWRSILPLDPTDAEVRSSIKTLEETIEARARGFFSEGTHAYDKGRMREGDSWMLKVLALQPGHPQALARLRKTQSDAVQAQANDKSQNENQVLKAHQKDENMDIHHQLRSMLEREDYRGMVGLVGAYKGKHDKEIARQLRTAYIALADQAEQKGDLELSLMEMQQAISALPLTDDPLVTRTAQLRNSLSNTWYMEGTRLMNVDLSKAISALEKSLYFNPYNNAAKRKLSQSKTLQRNLERIRGATNN